MGAGIRLADARAPALGPAGVRVECIAVVHAGPVKAMRQISRRRIAQEREVADIRALCAKTVARLHAMARDECQVSIKSLRALQIVLLDTRPQVSVAELSLARRQANVAMSRPERSAQDLGKRAAGRLFDMDECMHAEALAYAPCSRMRLCRSYGRFEVGIAHRRSFDPSPLSTETRGTRRAGTGARACATSTESK